MARAAGELTEDRSGRQDDTIAGDDGGPSGRAGSARAATRAPNSSHLYSSTISGPPQGPAAAFHRQGGKCGKPPCAPAILYLV